MKIPSRYTFYCLILMAMASCKPSSKTTTGLSPFAQSLRNTCVAPFVGRGDSSSFYLPTAFTPNGDGVDDYYGLVLSSYSFSNFALNVYDTMGTIVFNTTVGSRLMWDGTDMTTGKRSTKYKFYVKLNYTTTGGITDSGSTYIFLLTTDSVRRCVHVVAADTSKYEFPDQFLPGTGFVPHSSSFESYCN